MTDSIQDLKTLLEEADCLVDAQAIDKALDKMAANITKDLQDKLPLVICVMNGGLIPTAGIIERLDFPLELDYVHATRYGMDLEGAKLNWICSPQTSLKDRHVLIIDDIFDQGHTLQAIQKWIEEQGAHSTYTATIINKLHDRKTDITPDYIGIDVEDRFLFGYGMDYKGFFRNVKGIYAVKGS